MPSTHTQGWRVQRDSVDHYPTAIVDGERYTVARLQGTMEQRATNGPLLAATPALLAAAEAALEVFERENYAKQFYPVVLHQLRAAIALARGEDA